MTLKYQKQVINKGIYCLIIFLNSSRYIKIGKNRRIHFYKGYYLYVGSALNNLEKRIDRHKSSNKKLHWHIDYLLEHSKIITVKTIETKQKIECVLSKRISNIFHLTIQNFGNSDCNCFTHLYYSKTNPNKNKEFNNLFKNKIK